MTGGRGTILYINLQKYLLILFDFLNYFKMDKQFTYFRKVPTNLRAVRILRVYVKSLVCSI